MKLIPHVIAAFIFIQFASCAQKLDSTQWLNKHTNELKKDSTYNFDAIGKAIGDKKIVAIGESSHGMGEFYRLKSELVKYLHERKGFEVLAMEGGLGDINLAYSNIDTLAPTQLRDATVFGNFRATEANLLFEHIKNASATTTPLHYTGYDTQSSSNYVVRTLRPIVKAYAPKLADSLQQKFWAYGASYQAGNQGDSLGYYKYQKVFLDTAKEAQTILEENKPAVLDKYQLTQFQFEILIRTLQYFQKSYNQNYENRYAGGELRDKLMAENLQWLMETVYPNKKVIVWAHNAHVEKAGVINGHMKWMGHYIKETFPDDYYTIGLFAKEGNTFQHWNQETVPFNNQDSLSLERIMTQFDHQAAFLDLNPIKKHNTSTKWLFESVQAFEVENGGQINFVPHERFNGLITIKSSNIPTYEWQ